MEKNMLAVVCYTPVTDPDNINYIEVCGKENYDLINNFIIKNTETKRNPEINKFKSSGLYDIESIRRIKQNFPLVNNSDVKNLFDTFSTWAYTSSKTKNRYFGIIISSNFLFFYHFKPEEGITFVNDKIKDYIKYLDNSTITRFVFLTTQRVLKDYFDVESRDMQLVDDEEILYAYEKQHSKGFAELLSAKPVYDSKGEIKIRGEYDPETDLVVETHLDHFNNLNGMLSIDLHDRVIKISDIDIVIKEIQINGKKYDSKSAEMVNNQIAYELFNISPFLSELEFYKHKNKNSTIVETKEMVVLRDEQNNDIKNINKPISKITDKTTIFVLGLMGKQELKNDRCIEEIGSFVQNNPAFYLVELSKFNEKYNSINFGDITLLCKFKDFEETKKIASAFHKLIGRVEGQDNGFYKRILSLIALISINNFFKTKNVKEVVYHSSHNAISNIFSNLSPYASNMVLEEKDKLGIEFKAGTREDGPGFFDTSPKTFAKKLIGKTQSKRVDFIVYFIGINEDTKDFSPIPLSRIRNEFREEVKEELSKHNFIVPLIETIPLDDKNGILLIILNKSKVGR